jgi:predicted Zn-dependent peptidase
VKTVHNFNHNSYHKTVLDNGLTIISEKIDSVRSVTVGIWIKIGSRFEKVRENGISHFLEHMIFKGTPKRTPFKIARSLESLGGTLNAFTGKEVTCYFANTQDLHLRQVIEVLSDIVCHSVFPEKEIGKEQMVILEEIKSIKDTPEEYIFDIFSEQIFPDQALGWPVIGREQNIIRFNREVTVNFWNRYYNPNEIIIAAAGHLEHQHLVDLIQKYFTLDGKKNRKLGTPATAASSKNYVFNQPVNQAHICLGGKSCSYLSADRLPVQFISTYLGGGMSSCLFQKLREKKGLVYNVYSFIDFFSDIGVLGVYAAADTKKLNTVQQLVLEEINLLCKNSISTKNIKMVKEQLKGSFVLSLESTSSRMSKLAKNELFFGEYISVDTLLQQIDRVSAAEIEQAIQKYVCPSDFVTVILQPAH